MPATDSFRGTLVGIIPSLRAFAHCMCSNASHADSLVQDTLLRVIANKDTFPPGTTMNVWAFTILHSRLGPAPRKRRSADAGSRHAETLQTRPVQEHQDKSRAFRAALERLPRDQREALILVSGPNFSYKEAAAICGCAVGTIRSRVNRARVRLAKLVFSNSDASFGTDPVNRVAVSQ